MAIPSRQYQIPAGTLANLGPINPATVQTANTGVVGAAGGTPGYTVGGDRMAVYAGGSGGPSLAGMTPEQQLQAAWQGLGWDPNNANQYRGKQQQLVDYMAQHGGGNWYGSQGNHPGADFGRADDWMQDPSGKSYDIMTTGGKFVQNPDDPSAGAGGGAGGGGFSGNLMDDPGYQFQLGEGLKALQRSAAARGTLLTGGTLKGLQGYAQDYANTAYQNAFNRNYNVANMGLTAAGDLAGLNRSYGAAASGLMGDLGAVQAGGTLGKTQPWLGAMGEIGRGAQQQMGRSSVPNVPMDFTT